MLHRSLEMFQPAFHMKVLRKIKLLVLRFEDLTRISGVPHQIVLIVCKESKKIF